mgnify:CR=1 FL=1
MSNSKAIKNRIKSVKSTKKITKAMELVAAAKMKRAVSSALASRLYAGYSWEILTSIAENIEKISHPFFTEQETGKILVILITSNRGLCGGYNSQIIKKTLHKLKEIGQENDLDIITVGKKGDAAMRRINQNIFGVFTDISDVNIKLSDIVLLSKITINEYKKRAYKKVFIAYTHFSSALSQKPTIKQLLPISKEEIAEVAEALLSQSESKASARASVNKIDYLFDVDAKEFNEIIINNIYLVNKIDIDEKLLDKDAALARKQAKRDGEIVRKITVDGKVVKEYKIIVP